jgi:hypothetical protein
MRQVTEAGRRSGKAKREGGTRRWMGEGVEGPEGGRVEDEKDVKGLLT